VTLLGMVREKTQKPTKNGGMMAFVAFEDMIGETELVVFPRQLERLGAFLTEGRVLCVTGKLSVREAYDNEAEDELKLILDSASEPKEPFYDLYIKVTDKNAAALDKALAAVKKYSGMGRVCVYYEETGKLYSPKGLTASSDDALIDTLKAIMGGANVALKQRSK